MATRRKTSESLRWNFVSVQHAHHLVLENFAAPICVVVIADRVVRVLLALAHARAFQTLALVPAMLHAFAALVNVAKTAAHVLQIKCAFKAPENVSRTQVAIIWCPFVRLSVAKENFVARIAIAIHWTFHYRTWSLPKITWAKRLVLLPRPFQRVTALLWKTA